MMMSNIYTQYLTARVNWKIRQTEPLGVSEDPRANLVFKVLVVQGTLYQKARFERLFERMVSELE